MCFGAATLLDWNAKAVTSSYSRRETGELLMLVGERNAHAINELARRREKTAFSSVYIILADEGEDLVLRMKCAYALGMIGEDRALDSPEYADREEEVVILFCRILHDRLKASPEQESTAGHGAELSGTAACSSVVRAGGAAYRRTQQEKGREQKTALMLPLGAREARNSLPHSACRAGSGSQGRRR